MTTRRHASFRRAGSAQFCWGAANRLKLPLCQQKALELNPIVSGAKSGKEDAVEEFLLSALPLVEQEPGTEPWFAVRFGPSTFGIIDAFPDEAARETHLGGPVGKALAEKADELFASAPDISNLDIIASKP